MPTFTALPTDVVRAYQAGEPDAFGNAPERQISDGGGFQCRHCLEFVPEGEDMLLVAHKPFPGNHPYTEIGPLFVCAKPCERGGGEALPKIVEATSDYLIKGYSKTDRIVYGTGAIVPTEDLAEKIAQIFAQPEIAYIHARSSKNNCYQFRIDRDT